MQDPLIQSRIAQVLGAEGVPASAQNDEYRALINPSITARPLHIPESGSIKTIKNKEFKYFLAFDRCGSNPKHERVEALRATGEWDYATTDDVEMRSANDVKGKNEIRSGDRRLMKIPMQRWLEMRKDQMTRSLDMINPSRANAGPMGLGNMTPGMTHAYVDDASVRASARVSNASEDVEAIIAGGKAAGNASVAHVK
jgi:hypothetical protein